METVRLAANLLFLSVWLAALCITSTVHVYSSENDFNTNMFTILIKVL